MNLQILENIYIHVHIHTHMEGREVPAAASNINTIIGVRNIIIKHRGLLFYG